MLLKTRYGEYVYPSRIIVGSDEKNMEAAEVVTDMLKNGAIKKNIPVLFMTTTEAEAVKLFANTYVSGNNDDNTLYGSSGKDLINGGKRRKIYTQ